MEEKQQEKLIWSTDTVDQLMNRMDEGYKPKTNPFYEGNITLKKGNILFE